jgi:hypothetical protein
MVKAKKTVVKVNYFQKVTIPGPVPYSNFNPSWSITREETVDGDPNEASRGILAEIQGIVDPLAFAALQPIKTEEASDAEKLGHRFTDGFPHVTNIITPDKPQIPNIDDHAKLGTAYDEQMKQLMKHGKYDVYEEKLAFEYDFRTMMTGSIKNINDMRIVMVSDSLKIRHEGYKFCGEMDALVKFMDGIWLLDFKKTKNVTKDLREKYFKQIAAYASTQENIEGGIIFTPYEVIVEGHLQPYWEKFLVDRGIYKQRFGK